MSTPTATNGRLLWVDAARALAVLAVVLMHAILSIYHDHPQTGTSWQVWSTVAEQMTPFRIPALAMVSGMLLARRIRTGWTRDGAGVSVATSAWLYVVWLLAFALFAAFLPTTVWAGPLGSGDGFQLGAFVSQLVLPRTLLWFVFALAVWTALLTALRRVDPALVLVLLAALALWSQYLVIPDGSYQYRNVLRYALYFAIGVYGSDLIRRLIDTRLRMVLGVTAVAFVMLRGMRSVADDEYATSVLNPVIDTVAAGVLIAVAASVCRIGWVGRTLSWVGKRTLPIFVMHGLILESIALIPGVFEFFEVTRLHPISPLLIAGFCVAVSLGVSEVLMRTPLRVLFELPVRS